MDVTPDIRTSLEDTLQRWSNTLLSRNNTPSTFSNSTGWRQHFFVFDAIDIGHAVITFDEHEQAFIASYCFNQEHFISDAFPTEAEALASKSFSLRNSNLHQHQAIYLGQQWQVLNRACDSSTFPDDAPSACDRFVQRAGNKVCVNDYDCRETNNIALSLGNKAYVQPSDCSITTESLPARSSPAIKGEMAFVICDLPDDDGKNVEIQFRLTCDFKTKGKAYRAYSIVRFYETENISWYEIPAKDQLKAQIHLLLKSAILHNKTELERKFGGAFREGPAFPTDNEKIALLAEDMWSRIMIDYI